ncbi:unnamed protein product, partial [marine sediment metagenome]
TLSQTASMAYTSMTPIVTISPITLSQTTIVA